MTSIAFDTLDASATLRAAGLDEGVARAIVDVVKRTADLPDVTTLATRHELDVAVKGLHQRMDTLQTLIFAGFGLNLGAILAMGAFLYNVSK